MSVERRRRRRRLGSETIRKLIRWRVSTPVSDSSKTACSPTRASYSGSSESSRMSATCSRQSEVGAALSHPVLRRRQRNAVGDQGHHSSVTCSLQLKQPTCGGRLELPLTTVTLCECRNPAGSLAQDSEVGFSQGQTTGPGVGTTPFEFKSVLLALLRHRLRPPEPREEKHFAGNAYIEVGKFSVPLVCATSA